MGAGLLIASISKIASSPGWQTPFFAFFADPLRFFAVKSFFTAKDAKKAAKSAKRMRYVNLRAKVFRLRTSRALVSTEETKG